MPDQVKVLNPNGINKDLRPYELSDDKWSDGNNIQFKDSKTKKVKGHKEVFGTPTVAPHWLLPFTTPTTNFWIYAGLSGIHKVTGTTHTNITRQTDDVDVPYTATTGSWNGGVLGGVAILNNGSDAPQQFGSASSKCEALDNWGGYNSAGASGNTDIVWKTSVMRPFKQFLVALNITEGSNKYPYRVRWSHPAEGGTVPASWQVSGTSDAGYVDLSQTNGWVVDCLPLKDINVVYKEDSVWGMSYEGGQSVFRFFEMFSDAGILSSRCVKGFGDKHFVVTNGDVYIHNSQTKESIIDSQMKESLFDSINPDFFTQTFVAPNYSANEMWVCFVSNENSDTTPYADKAYVWNWVDNSWSVRDIPNTAHIGWGIIDTTTESGQWDDDDYSWSSDGESWDNRGYNPSKTSMLFLGTKDTKFYEGNTTSTANGSNIAFSVEKTGMLLDYPGVKSVKKIVPRLTSTQDVDFYVGTEMITNSGVVWKGPYTFTPGTHSEIPVRASGTYISVKAETNNDTGVELDNLEIHWSPAGVRTNGV